MITRKERTEELYGLTDKKSSMGTALRIGLIGLAAGLWFYGNFSLSHSAMFLFVTTIAVPLSYMSWRKTRTQVSFNDNRAYRGLIRVKGIGDIAMLWGMFGLMVGYELNFFELSTLSSMLASILIVHLLAASLIDKRLLRIDDEHVVDSLFGLTKREQMKRKWDEK
ncbi:hypothetical protein EVJ30_04660 [Exiguobacterium sp. SH5S13]|uniref:hypothetical protein n=1 Tax=Exiguobacterium sp. SH5S13 TaxID=2510959 RepID=UPI00103AFA15|nr:hypothetical protein [Exiguobacterium sp. SH5S13]TCI56183.1 hypothetical protein EVJ30_04660 [Exiguobacterium sp. SH5S13]